MRSSDERRNLAVDAEYFRGRAARCLKLAAAAEDEGTAAKLRALAADYLEQATRCVLPDGGRTQTVAGAFENGNGPVRPATAAVPKANP